MGLSLIEATRTPPVRIVSNNPLKFNTRLSSQVKLPIMERIQKKLSHAEVWDDSALQKSWDDALSEYKLYHGIHARGERVEDVLREYEAEAETAAENERLIPDESNASSKKKPTYTPAEHLEDNELEDGEMRDEYTEPVPTLNTSSSTMPPHPMQSHEKNHAMYQSVDVPQRIISNVKDEALRNLMMSWYYAGYYTGLYEGQQSVNTAPSDSRDGVNGS